MFGSSTIFHFQICSIILAVCLQKIEEKLFSFQPHFGFINLGSKMLRFGEIDICLGGEMVFATLYVCLFPSVFAKTEAV